MARRKKLTWREAIDLAPERRRKRELDILREYDRTGRLPSPEEVENEWLKRRGRARPRAATR